VVEGLVVEHLEERQGVERREVSVVESAVAVGGGIGIERRELVRVVELTLSCDRGQRVSIDERVTAVAAAAHCTQVDEGREAREVLGHDAAEDAAHLTAVQQVVRDEVGGDVRRRVNTDGVVLGRGQGHHRCPAVPERAQDRVAQEVVVPAVVVEAAEAPLDIQTRLEVDAWTKGLVDVRTGVAGDVEVGAVFLHLVRTRMRVAEDADEATEAVFDTDLLDAGTAVRILEPEGPHGGAHRPVLVHVADRHEVAAEHAAQVRPDPETPAGPPTAVAVDEVVRVVVAHEPRRDLVVVGTVVPDVTLRACTAEEVRAEAVRHAEALRVFGVVVGQRDELTLVHLAHVAVVDGAEHDRQHAVVPEVHVAVVPIGRVTAFDLDDVDVFKVGDRFARRFDRVVAGSECTGGRGEGHLDLLRLGFGLEDVDELAIAIGESGLVVETEPMRRRGRPTAVVHRRRVGVFGHALFPVLVDDATRRAVRVAELEALVCHEGAVLVEASELLVTLGADLPVPLVEAHGVPGTAEVVAQADRVSDLVLHDVLEDDSADVVEHVQTPLHGVLDVLVLLGHARREAHEAVVEELGHEHVAAREPLHALEVVVTLLLLELVLRELRQPERVLAKQAGRLLGAAGGRHTDGARSDHVHDLLIGGVFRTDEAHTETHLHLRRHKQVLVLGVLELFPDRDVAILVAVQDLLVVREELAGVERLGVEVDETALVPALDSLLSGRQLLIELCVALEVLRRDADGATGTFFLPAEAGCAEDLVDVREVAFDVLAEAVLDRVELAVDEVDEVDGHLSPRVERSAVDVGVGADRLTRDRVGRARAVAQRTALLRIVDPTEEVVADVAEALVVLRTVADTLFVASHQRVANSAVLDVLDLCSRVGAEVEHAVGRLVGAELGDDLGEDVVVLVGDLDGLVEEILGILVVHVVDDRLRVALAVRDARVDALGVEAVIVFVRVPALPDVVAVGELDARVVAAAVEAVVGTAVGAEEAEPLHLVVGVDARLVALHLFLIDALEARANGDRLRTTGAAPVGEAKGEDAVDPVREEDPARRDLEIGDIVVRREVFGVADVPVAFGVLALCVDEVGVFVVVLIPAFLAEAELLDSDEEPVFTGVDIRLTPGDANPVALGPVAVGAVLGDHIRLLAGRRVVLSLHVEVLLDRERHHDGAEMLVLAVDRCPLESGGTFFERGCVGGVEADDIFVDATRQKIVLFDDEADALRATLISDESHGTGTWQTDDGLAHVPLVWILFGSGQYFLSELVRLCTVDVTHILGTTDRNQRSSEKEAQDNVLLHCVLLRLRRGTMVIV